jgi:hypothetical protein
MSASARVSKKPLKGLDKNCTRKRDKKNGLFQYHFAEFLIDHLIDCLRLFGGDLEEMLVLEVVRQRSLLARLDALGKKRQQEEEIDVAVTASHIANKTGIPRQTVRRKLLSLERRGWVTHADNSTWRLATRKGELAICTDLASFDQRGAGRLAKLIEASISM